MKGQRERESSRERRSDGEQGQIMQGFERNVQDVHFRSGGDSKLLEDFE